jgi:hypothetical protein
MSLETSDVLLSNDIIFVLYNLYYVGQSDDLGMRAGPINLDRGSCNAQVGLHVLEEEEPFCLLVG